MENYSSIALFNLNRVIIKFLGHEVKMRPKRTITLDLHTKMVYTICEVMTMLKNITLSAEEKLIEIARKKANENHTTLNNIFRQWLEGYARDKTLVLELNDFLLKTNYVSSERSYNRDELNER